MLELNKIYNQDCLEGMKLIDDKSIDLILVDLPYGTTQCKWDSIIPLDKLWIEYNRIIKEKCPIVLFCAQPFTSQLISSNINNYKYNWIWKKNVSTGFLNAKHQPLRITEDIAVFCSGKSNYFPQMRKGEVHIRGGKSKNVGGDIYNDFSNRKITISDEYYPNNLLEFSSVKKPQHPTQKPVELCEYLIKTYSNEGDLVLDNCVGSGTTCLAAKNTNRNFIGFETSEEYCKIAEARL